MKKLIYLIVLALILGLVLTGCFLSNVGQVPTNEQSGITYLTKNGILNPDLVALWRFNSDATDSSGNGNDGTVYGGKIYEDPSPMGQALSFDGTVDYVEVAHADSLDVTSAYTIEVWVNVTDVPNNIYRPILFRGTTNANDIEVYIQAISKGLVVAHNRGNGGTFDYVRFDAPPIGEWFHLAVTFDGTDVQAYYGGTAITVNQNTTQMVPPLDTEKDWWIGKVDHTAFGTLSGGSSVNLFKGLIDEVRIWKVPLLQGQLGSLIYDFGGILPPIKADGSSVFKLGRTIPVKFQLRDANGDFVSTAVANIYLTKTSNGVIGIEEDAVSTAAATTGNLFRYDDTDNQYIFNLATKLLSVGTWEIRIELDDGMSYYVEIGLK